MSGGARRTLPRTPEGSRADWQSRRIASTPSVQDADRAVLDGSTATPGGATGRGGVAERVSGAAGLQGLDGCRGSALR